MTQLNVQTTDIQYTKLKQLSLLLAKHVSLFHEVFLFLCIEFNKIRTS